ncbi:hypothetical protein EMIT079MI2_420010 [Bacillus sp. IT-79MI2]
MQRLSPSETAGLGSPYQKKKIVRYQDLYVKNPQKIRGKHILVMSNMCLPLISL